MKTLIENRKAHFDYSISDRLTAGMVLTGPEVKSLKKGQGSLGGAFVILRDGEAFLTNAHISPYPYASSDNQLNPDRDRKLLLTTKEISALVGKEKGTSIIPLQIIQTDHGFVKIILGIGKGKKQYDKRQTIKRRETDLKIRRYM